MLNWNKLNRGITIVPLFKACNINKKLEEGETHEALGCQCEFNKSFTGALIKTLMRTWAGGLHSLYMTGNKVLEDVFLLRCPSHSFCDYEAGYFQVCSLAYYSSTSVAFVENWDVTYVNRLSTRPIRPAMKNWTYKPSKRVCSSPPPCYLRDSFKSLSGPLLRYFSSTKSIKLPINCHMLKLFDYWQRKYEQALRKRGVLFRFRI